MNPQAFSEMIGGKVYDLSLDLHPGMPVHHTHPPFLMTLWRRHTESREEVSAAVEFMTLCGHHSTHLDAPCHFANRHKLYGGLQVSKFETPAGYRRHDVKHVQPIVKRAVLMDIAASKRVRKLGLRYPITLRDIRHALSFAGLKIERGDVALVRTGWSPLWYDKKKSGLLFTDSPGMTKEAVDWLVQKGISGFGVDGDADLPGSSIAHRTFLADNGILIIERMYLEELARDRRYTSLFFCSPLKISGATGSPVRPIAIVPGEVRSGSARLGPARSRVPGDG